MHYGRWLSILVGGRGSSVLSALPGISFILMLTADQAADVVFTCCRQPANWTVCTNVVFEFLDYVISMNVIVTIDWFVNSPIFELAELSWFSGE